MLSEEVEIVSVKPEPLTATDNRNLRLLFGLTALAIVIASVVGAGLSWDGSYILFKVLDTQAPFVVHGRWFVAPLQLPVLLASQFTGDQLVLQTVFSLAYALVPLLALALSWWIVRDTQPGLFVWAAIGILLIALPGQFCLVSDANMALQLFWPVILAVLTDLRRPKLYAVAGLSLVLLFSHPVAIPLFALVAVLAILRGWRSQYERPAVLLWAGVFGLLTAVSIAKFFLTSDTYEDEQLSVAVLERQYQGAVAGWPLLFIGAVWLMALLLFAAPFVRRPSLVRSLRAVEVGCLVVGGGALLIWVSNPRLWERGIDFRLWALILTLPIIGLAVAESLWLKTYFSPARTWAHRGSILGSIGIVFVLVLAVQSTSWLSQTNRLREALAQSQQSCLTPSAVNWTAQTPLGHWSLTPYSLLIGGKTPGKVILPEAGCAQERIGESIKITDWDTRAWKSGWFDTTGLRLQLIAQQPAANTCRYSLASGWYQTEQAGAESWQWSEGTGRLEVFSPKDGEIVLNGTLRSAQQPNQVKVAVNGQDRATLNVTWEDSRPLEPLSLPLKAGRNEISFISRNQATKVANDNRMLAIMLGNLRLTDRNNGPACGLQNR